MAITDNLKVEKSQSSFKLYIHHKYFLICPGLLFLAVMVIFPMVFLFRTSLYDLTFMNFRSGEASFIGLGNFAELLFEDKRLLVSIKNTFLFVFVGVSCQFVFGLIMALVFNKVLRHNLFISILMLPSMMTPIVVGLLWRYILNSDFGIVSQLLMLLGYSKQAWLSNPKIAIYVLLIIDFWQWTPFMFLILLAGLQTMTPDTLEAARVDGASGIVTLFYIILPIIKPIALVAVTFRIMDAFKLFDIIAVLTGGGPGSSTYTLILKAMIDGFTHFRLAYSASVSIVTLILVTIFSLLFLRIIYKEMGEEELLMR